MIQEPDNKLIVVETGSACNIYRRSASLQSLVICSLYSLACIIVHKICARIPPMKYAAADGDSYRW